MARAAPETTFATLIALMVVVLALVSFPLLEGVGVASTTQAAGVRASSANSTECAPPSGNTGNSTHVITGTGWPDCDCALVASNSNGMLYVSTNGSVGDDICLAASLYGSDQVAFAITTLSGSVVFQTGFCVSSGGLGTSSSTGISCESDWNTAAPGESGGVVKFATAPITPGTYKLAALAGPGSPAVLEANFTLG